MPGKLIIVCGLPGSGKTTRAKELECAPNVVRLSPDEWMEALAVDVWDDVVRAKVEALQWQLAQRLLTAGLTVVIEWGTWARSERDVLRAGARALGAAVELHYLTAPLHVLLERIERRGIEHPPVTHEHLAKWAKLFQAPTADELELYDERAS